MVQVLAQKRKGIRGLCRTFQQRGTRQPGSMASILLRPVGYSKHPRWLFQLMRSPMPLLSTSPIHGRGECPESSQNHEAEPAMQLASRGKREAKASASVDAACKCCW